MLHCSRPRRKQSGAALANGMQFLCQQSGIPFAPLAFKALAYRNCKRASRGFARYPGQFISQLAGLSVVDIQTRQLPLGKTLRPRSTLQHRNIAGKTNPTKLPPQPRHIRPPQHPYHAPQTAPQNPARPPPQRIPLPRLPAHHNRARTVHPVRHLATDRGIPARSSLTNYCRKTSGSTNNSETSTPSALAIPSRVLYLGVCSPFSSRTSVTRPMPAAPARATWDRPAEVSQPAGCAAQAYAFPAWQWLQLPADR